MEHDRGRFLSSFALKILALSTMVIDHVGAVLFPEYLWLRCIGRLSFPIFAFLLAEGYRHTRDVNAYLRRLLLFAVISEPCFDLAFYGRLFYPYGQNIFFTLGISLFALDHLQQGRSRYGRAAWLLAAVLAAELLHTDYGFAGVLMVLAFYFFRSNLPLMTAAVCFINIVLMGWIQSFGAVSMIPVALYNGRKGYSMKYFFYAFYPLHLLILAWIRAAA